MFVCVCERVKSVHFPPAAGDVTCKAVASGARNPEWKADQRKKGIKSEWVT